MRKMLLFFCWSLLFTATIVRAQNALTFGEAVTGSIGEGQLGVTYTFEGESGESVYITMFAPNFDLDPELQLTGPGGVLLAREAYNNLVGALIGPLELPDDGAYTVIASGANGSSGDFNLLVDRASVTPLAMDDAIGGSLPAAGAMVFYTFDGQADALIRYRLDALAAGFALVAPSGEVILSDGMYDNPASFFNILPETGAYQAAIMTLQPGGTDFELTVAPVEPVPIASGEPLSGSILESSPQVFTFSSAAGKMWQLNAQVADAEYSTTLDIYNGNDPSYSIAGDRSSGPGGFPRIEPFIAPEDATYYVLLTFDDGTQDDASRDFEVSVAPSSLLSLSPGQAVEAKVTSETGNAVYAYSGKAGETVRVTLTRTGETGWPGLVMWSQARQGRVFEIITEVEIGTASIEVTLPDDGMYLLTIYNYSSDAPELSFSILVERVE